MLMLSFFLIFTIKKIQLAVLTLLQYLSCLYEVCSDISMYSNNSLNVHNYLPSFPKSRNVIQQFWGSEWFQCSRVSIWSWNFWKKLGIKNYIIDFPYYVFIGVIVYQLNEKWKEKRNVYCTLHFKNAQCWPQSPYIEISELNLINIQTFY